MIVDGAGRMPGKAEEERCWGLIESAWAACGPAAAAARRALIDRDPATDGEAELSAVDAALPAFLAELSRLSESLTSAELTALDRVVERKLYDIDREEIHEHTDGSDDGFLYCRGFIVALGRAFYDAVDANPALAVLDAECESMCYFFAHLHNTRFGDFPETGSGISRESFHNPQGW